MELRVAAVQLCSGSNVSRNIDEAVRLINVAADEGAQYIQVPEYFNCYSRFPDFADAAETIPGPTTARMADLAKSRGVTLHLGSLLEVSSAIGKFHNTSVVIGPRGDITALYRKVHLFDVNVPGAVVSRESDFVEPGSELVIARSKEYALGLSICFDVRFPEMYRELAVAGADVLAIPAAFNADTGKAHWELLVRARAIENHAFVVAATQVGTNDVGIATYGHALIVDPWGVVLAESMSEAPDVIVANLDLSDVQRRRDQISVNTVRRPDVYDGSVRIVEVM